MQSQKKYEILDGLPAYGPMYVPISKDSIKFYHEGFVVRLFRSDGTNWVANFKTGGTSYSSVFELPKTDIIVVIANGQGYTMTPDLQNPVNTFGHSITEVISTNDGRLIGADITDLIVINSDATIWRSERISWDGIKDLTLLDNIISGLAYDPMHESEEWVNFSFNLDTKKFIEGSYRRHHFEKVKKPFWKFW
jgi:hypothetical protein